MAHHDFQAPRSITVQVGCYPGFDATRIAPTSGQLSFASLWTNDPFHFHHFNSKDDLAVFTEAVMKRCTSRTRSVSCVSGCDVSQ